MRRPNGFLLIEILCALAVLAAAVAATADALASARLAARRRTSFDAIAACAETRLLLVLGGADAPRLPCAEGVRAEMETAPLTGDLLTVTWRITTPAAGPESFLAIRHAR